MSSVELEKNIYVNVSKYTFSFVAKEDTSLNEENEIECFLSTKNGALSSPMLFEHAEDLD